MCWFSAEDDEKWKMKLKMTRGAFDEIHGASSHVDVTSTWGRPTKVTFKINGQGTISIEANYITSFHIPEAYQVYHRSAEDHNIVLQQEHECLDECGMLTSRIGYDIYEVSKKVDFRLPFQSCFLRLKERISIHVQYTLRLSNYFTV
ncbi:hypothetical protein BDN70DRAFT_507968 [Pholiota conissans]|uniref:Uncharacterized protein n=1 Tax=Pholiota conissans TaxID=109636 RepID=A0A9P5Z725_9AGAR|nr:hypothetical protein BDN70DRAFT_507968 [Pholiota conissans]